MCCDTCGHVQEYMRQVRLEEIIRDTQQVALREKAMEMLASSRHLGARGSPAAYFGPAPPAAPGMNPFQQQHLQHQLFQVAYLATHMILLHRQLRKMSFLSG